jgi:hypothetical protein
MFDWLERRRDKGVGWGQCEARLGYGFGMKIVCGTWTKMFSGTYWYCERHHPSGCQANQVKAPV